VDATTEVAETTESPRAPQLVARGAGHWGVFLGLAAVVVVFDQLTKAWLVANIAQGDVREVLGHTVRLVYHQNSGALFGLSG
jgi:lipoprotein signal peptidase